MALTLEGSDALTPIVNDWSMLANVVGPGVFSAALDLRNHDGVEVIIRWQLSVLGTIIPVWSETVTVDVAALAGYLTVPVPVYDQAVCDLFMPATGSTDTIGWEIYRL